MRVGQVLWGGGEGEKGELAEFGLLEFGYRGQSSLLCCRIEVSQ